MFRRLDIASKVLSDTLCYNLDIESIALALHRLIFSSVAHIVDTVAMVTIMFNYFRALVINGHMRCSATDLWEVRLPPYGRRATADLSLKSRSVWKSSLILVLALNLGTLWI